MPEQEVDEPMDEDYYPEETGEEWYRTPERRSSETVIPDSVGWEEQEMIRGRSCPN